MPHKVIANDWPSVEGLPGDEVVLKAHGSLFFKRNQPRVVYTSVLRKNRLPKNTSAYPGIWQSYIPKAREWRVTVVGEDVFCAAIYTKGVAVTDWRRYQNTKNVTFQVEAGFPAELQERCRRFLDNFGLRFGAFDFIETPDGEFIFLEVNPNGQYGWLEGYGLDISEAIARELAIIARE